ncbi:Iron-sulfur cluster repair protein YtfE [Pirellulimonas nuda]|uniref:Iron-sulfur cluster repair protein YtfE n=1 Tax=Pirellulimonas nuda TaxID=2528009 RepID=A0A518DED1_9BACT|nr:iron-sulfur cluster repair di-iron protein [Pirellulimonas nuda]QDU89792.1 Iron-sulfur cluster repair protein YtfE [Pirellulimonas nuda]
MQTIDPQATVGELVRAVPGRARVFESLKIDYCCGGKVPLAEACAKMQVAPEAVLDALGQVDGAERTPLVDADCMGLTELADHIEQTHHAYLREELPRLDFLTEKVSRVHGDKDPRLATVREAFLALKNELEPHMMKEEVILFPLIRELEASADQPQQHGCGVAGPIRQMEHEHDLAGDALAILREATDGFAPPEWACNTYRAMLDSLDQLEADMHQHIHKENNVLFPKALAMGA